MPIYATYQINLNEFIEARRLHKVEYKSGDPFVASAGFSLEFVDPLHNSIKKQLAEQGLSYKEIFSILYSPAAFNLGEFGLGEQLKNSEATTMTNEGLATNNGATEVNIVVVVKNEDERVDSLDPESVAVIIFDNGPGFSDKFLAKDPERKEGGPAVYYNIKLEEYRKKLFAGLTDVHSEAYKDKFAEFERTKNDFLKITSSKVDDKTSAAGLKRGGMGMGIASEDENVRKVGGRTETTNIQDSSKNNQPILDMIRAANIVLPPQGGAVVFSSPILSDDLISKFENQFRPQYKATVNRLKKDEAEAEAKEIEAEEDSFSTMAMTPTSPFSPKSSVLESSLRTPLSIDLGNFGEDETGEVDEKAVSEEPYKNQINQLIKDTKNEERKFWEEVLEGDYSDLEYNLESVIDTGKYDSLFSTFSEISKDLIKSILPSKQNLFDQDQEPSPHGLEVDTQADDLPPPLSAATPHSQSEPPPLEPVTPQQNRSHPKPPIVDLKLEKILPIQKRIAQIDEKLNKKFSLRGLFSQDNKPYPFYKRSQKIAEVTFLKAILKEYQTGVPIETAIDKTKQNKLELYNQLGAKTKNVLRIKDEKQAAAPKKGYT